MTMIMGKNIAMLTGRATLALLLALATATTAEARIKHLLPTPKEVTPCRCMTPLPEHFRFDSNQLTPRLAQAFTLLMGTEASTTEGMPVSIAWADELNDGYDYRLYGYDSEYYELSVDVDGISIVVSSETGVVRALQTLAQLCEGCDDGQLECCTVKDWPAFKLRGYMHDVGRSYIPFDELKHELLLMARFKVNTFHWHLTENQAWRFEVKQYPQLTSAASMTRFPGLYYTQEQCRELDSLAWVLGINLIPEIDMPGHSQAFQRAMGHTMQTARGVEELQNILDEVAATFVHAPYIHIGADETQITYRNFLRTMTDRVHALGKKVVVWNPASGVAITTAAGIDMTQMWSAAAKAVQGMPNIDCRYNYVNHFDLFADLAGIYRSNIYYEPQGSEQLAGTITAVWNDRYIETAEGIIRQNNLYANTLASAERAWRGGGHQYIEQGGALLPWDGDETREFCDWERRFLWHKAHALRAEPIAYVRQQDVEWQITDAFPNGGDAEAVFPPETEGPKDSYVYDGQTYHTGHARGGAVYLRHVWGTLVPAYYADPQLDHTAYAWTWVYSPTAQQAGALIEFQNYSRSEQDVAPANGQWDCRGSHLWLNDVEINGPDWDNAGQAIDKEVPLGNENLTARPPVVVSLRQGWNKVFMKLPYVNTPGVRLNKWMFTFVLTDVEGRNALDGITYSATPLPPTQSVSTAVAPWTAAPVRYDLQGRKTASRHRGIAVTRGRKSLRR